MGVTAVQAQNSVPTDEELLVEFYMATDGDNWTTNDGWLDPDTPVCDWFGIECRVDPETDQEKITELLLPDNNLNGVLASGSPFDSDIFNVPSDAIDLSGNNLGGALERIPFNIERIDLSRNLFSGTLPNARDGVIIGTPPPDFFSRMKSLNLSSNRFEGAVPEDWHRFELRLLDLSGNDLDDGAENAFAAMREAGGGRLNLADNEFSGSLSPQVTGTSLFHAVGLNLCWNDFSIDDEGLAEWIDEHHVGGDNWQDCFNRERIPVDLTVSGSWYVPARSGEGVAMQLLGDGRALLYSFTFDLDGNQMWLFEVGSVFDLHLNWPQLWETRGDFGSGFRLVDGQRVIGGDARLRIDRLGDRTMQFERQLTDMRACPPLGESQSEGEGFFPCPIDFLSDRFENTQLTRLAGTTCENQRPSVQDASGAWYDPERSGEGFFIEILEDGRAVVYWFTYKPDGSGEQAWMMGVGDAVFFLV